MNDPSSDTLQVDINDATNQSASLLNRIRRAVVTAASHRGFHGGSIGVAIVDDAAIHEINKQHLAHDYPTDVISFAYAADGSDIEGELVVSRDTAQREASALGWDFEKELILYVVHGTLHICGLEDTTHEDRQIMRHAERAVLAKLDIDDVERFCPDGGQQ